MSVARWSLVAVVTLLVPFRAAAAAEPGASPEPGASFTSLSAADPATPFQRSLRKTLAERSAAALPVPSSVEYSYQVLGDAGAAVSAKGLSEFRGQRIRDNELKRSIGVYNHTRELMQQFYELRKRDRPPVTGAETLEMMKAAGRMPREQYNELLEQLLDEVKRSGREIRKGKRLMIAGNDIHNSGSIAAIEEMDAIVVTDEMNIGTRYFWGRVDTTLPPMEGIARHYMFNRPQEAMIYQSNRFEHLFRMARDYRVDGVVAEVLPYCVPLENDKPWLGPASVRAAAWHRRPAGRQQAGLRKNPGNKIVLGGSLNGSIKRAKPG